MRRHVVSVGPLPDWMPVERLLGGADWTLGESPWNAAGGSYVAERSMEEAARIAARLRGLGFAGHPVEVHVRPPLARTAVRQGRLDEARALRSKDVGFEHPLSRVDAEGRIGLTPEHLAMDVARRAAQCGVRRAVDAFCGLGGNAIAFARAGCDVIAFELDPERASMARHNARVYDVGHRVDIRVGDALVAATAADREADLLFVDPPWGVDWNHRRTDVDDFVGLRGLIHDARAPRVWLKVPSSFDPSSVDAADVVPHFSGAEGNRCRVRFLVIELRARR